MSIPKTLLEAQQQGLDYRRWQALIERTPECSLGSSLSECDGGFEPCADCGDDTCEEHRVTYRHLASGSSSELCLVHADERQFDEAIRDEIAFFKRIQWHLAGSGWDERSDTEAPDLNDILLDLRNGWREAA